MDLCLEMGSRTYVRGTINEQSRLTAVQLNELNQSPSASMFILKFQGKIPQFNHNINNFHVNQLL